MSAKHTPGPWFNEGTDIFSTAGGYPAVIAEADVPQDEPKPTNGEKFANATLIAAAPELLEVLEECRGQLALIESKSGYEQPFMLRLIARADAAIAKAKGGAA